MRGWTDLARCRWWSLRRRRSRAGGWGVSRRLGKLDEDGEGATHPAGYGVDVYGDADLDY